jgi:hypothetical protein
MIRLRNRTNEITVHRVSASSQKEAPNPALQIESERSTGEAQRNFEETRPICSKPPASLIEGNARDKYFRDHYPTKDFWTVRLSMILLDPA